MISMHQTGAFQTAAKRAGRTAELAEKVDVRPVTHSLDNLMQSVVPASFKCNWLRGSAGPAVNGTIR
jgi:hypothetical protein